MSYPNDPIRTLALRFAATGAAGVAALALTAWWSLTPPELPSPVIEPVHVADQPKDESVRTLASLDRAAFDAVLWSPPEPPEPPKATAEQERPAPPPPELLLLAITREGERRVAALYDKRLNRVVLALPGDAIADVTITAISDSAVEFSWGDRRSQLVLRKDES